MDEIKFSESFVIEEIRNYVLERRFGSYTKNDFEVLIFQALLMGELKDKSNYEISRLLCIPESKVKRLKYEADLKHNHSKDYNTEMFGRLNELLDNVKLKLDKNPDNFKIQFVIEDPALRKFLDNKLKRDGSFSDSSFNSEIVSISPDDFLTIIDSFPEGVKVSKELNENAHKIWEEYREKNKMDKENNPYPGFRQIWPLFLLSIAKTAENTTKTAANLTGKFTIANLLENASMSVLRRLNIFKNEICEE